MALISTLRRRRPSNWKRSCPTKKSALEIARMPEQIVGILAIKDVSFTSQTLHITITGGWLIIDFQIKIKIKFITWQKTTIQILQANEDHRAKSPSPSCSLYSASICMKKPEYMKWYSIFNIVIYHIEGFCSLVTLWLSYRFRQACSFLHTDMHSNVLFSKIWSLRTILITRSYWVSCLGC